MKNRDLLKGINHVDDKYIGEAERQRPFERRRKKWRIFVEIAVCVCLVVGLSIFKVKEDSMAAEYTIVQAKYPETLAYPVEPDGYEKAAWEKYTDLVDEYYKQSYERRQCSKDYQDGLFTFYEKTMEEFLISEKNNNRVYSPLNLYMALSMLAELTDGNSRAQLLQLLGKEEMETVRESARALWEANYAADGVVECKLANSVWLRQGVDYVPKTMQQLADIYHASSFQGDTATEEYTKALQKWLNEQTGGLLQEQAAGIKLRPETILALASTIYYRAQWANQFYKENTKEGIFHAETGDITCDFMHQKDINSYFFGENFSAINRGFDFSGGMWLILPDKGSSVNELIQSKEVLRLIKDGYGWKDKTSLKVNLSMPKFDIASDLDLAGGLKSMGVTDIFDAGLANFSPMTVSKEEPPYLSDAKHAARVLVDEEGCQAAAFTVMGVAGAGMPPDEEIDFVLDRPFIFAITGADGSLLFLGVVEEP